MTTPIRIQRERIRGWRKPPNSVIVDRTSRYGNPHRIGPCLVCGVEHTREEAIAEFRATIKAKLAEQPDALAPLRGKDLICFCRLDQACHADVLLELANREMSGMSDRYCKTCNCLLSHREIEYCLVHQPSSESPAPSGSDVPRCSTLLCGSPAAWSVGGGKKLKCERCYTGNGRHIGWHDGVRINRPNEKLTDAGGESRKD